MYYLRAEPRARSGFSRARGARRTKRRLLPRSTQRSGASTGLGHARRHLDARADRGLAGSGRSTSVAWLVGGFAALALRGASSASTASSPFVQPANAGDRLRVAMGAERRAVLYRLILARRGPSRSGRAGCMRRDRAARLMRTLLFGTTPWDGADAGRCRRGGWRRAAAGGLPAGPCAASVSRSMHCDWMNGACWRGAAISARRLWGDAAATTRG